MAGGQHAIGVAIAAVARQPHLLARRGRRRAVGAVEHLGRRRNRVASASDCAAAHRQLALTPFAPEIRRPPSPKKRSRCRAGASCRTAGTPLCSSADQRAPQRQAGDEGLGAVDRVEHPDIFGVRALVAEFLADDAVLRKCRADQPAHRGFRRAVGLGHRIEAAARLVVDAEEVRKNGRIVSPDTVASLSMKAAKSMTVTNGPRTQASPADVDWAEPVSQSLARHAIARTPSRQCQSD